MEKASVVKNYIYNMSYQLLAIIVPLITTPYISRVLGAEAIGIYSYTLSITTYFVLFGSLGIALYGQREIAFVQEDKTKRSKVFIEIMLLRLITLAISMIVFYCTFCLSGEYTTYYKIFLLEMIATAIDISWFFRGMENFKRTVIRNMIVKLISVVCIFVFVKTVDDLNIYCWIYVISNMIGNLSLWFYLPKLLNKVKIKSLQIGKHLKPTIGLFIPQMAVQIYTVLDKTMIGAMVVDKSEVGYYEQSQKIVKVLLTVATSLGTVMLPRIANTFAKGENEKIRKYMDTSFQFILFLVIPVMFGMIAVSSKFVPLFFGAGYDKVIILINIMSVILVAIGLSNVIGTQYLLPTKQQKKYTLSVTAGAIVNAILNYILIKSSASIGAAIATVIAEFTVTGMQLFLVRKQINIWNIVKISRNYWIAGAVMFAIVVTIGQFITNDMLSICMQGVIGILIYMGLLIILKDALVGKAINKIKKNKKNKGENEL